jgi:hypothetical protein
MVAIKSPPSPAATVHKLQPVQWWAGFGAVTFAFVAYLMIRWVTGPNFVRVPVGPSEPPTAMKVVLNTGQIVLSVTAVIIVYWFWSGRGGKVAADHRRAAGARLPARGGSTRLATTSHWIVYNAYLPNRGPVAEVPAERLRGAGATTVELFPFLPPCTSRCSS